MRTTFETKHNYSRGFLAECQHQATGEKFEFFKYGEGIFVAPINNVVAVDNDIRLGSQFVCYNPLDFYNMLKRDGYKPVMISHLLRDMLRPYLA